MPLNKTTFKNEIYEGFYRIFTQQASKATSGDESEDPESVIKRVANEMAVVVTDAVEKYVKAGDIFVDATNVQVVSSSPGSPAVVTPLSPAKLE